MSSYTNCFQKHSFEELNSIDEDKLTIFMNTFLKTHKLHENSNIFDVLLLVVSCFVKNFSTLASLFFI